MTKTKFLLLLAIGIVAAAVWLVMAFQEPALRPELLTYVKAAVIGIVGLVLRDMPPPSPPTAPAVVQTVPANPAIQPA